MIFEQVFHQVARTKGRARNCILVRDKQFSVLYRQVLRFRRDAAAGKFDVPAALEAELEELATNSKAAVRFRLMSNFERAKAGLKAPRMVVEPSPRLKRVIRQIDEFFAAPKPSAPVESDEQRSRAIRSATRMGGGAR